MSAMYQIIYRTDTRTESFILHAADAKAMTRAACNAATRNAAKRARERLKKLGKANAVITSIKCVG